MDLRKARRIPSALPKPVSRAMLFNEAGQPGSRFLPGRVQVDLRTAGGEKRPADAIGGAVRVRVSSTEGDDRS
jgi:hypothetical protein